jgi:hypothetical protein
MFEQTVANQNLKLAKKLESNQENIEESSSAQETSSITTSNKINKPLPPIPSKPPRPIFQQPSLEKSSSITNTKPKSDESVRQPSIMVKLRPVNGNANKELNSENVTITLNNTSSDSAQPEKRASVKELAQMLNEESKVIFLYF